MGETDESGKSTGQPKTADKTKADNSSKYLPKIEKFCGGTQNADI